MAVTYTKTWTSLGGTNQDRKGRERERERQTDRQTDRNKNVLKELRRLVNSKYVAMGNIKIS